MKAVGLYKYLPIEEPDSLVEVDLPKPEATGSDLLVRVEAVSVNPVDTKVRAPGKPDRTTPHVLGWDAAGMVEAIGPAVTLFKRGDEVYYAGDITRPGSNSQYQLVDERIVGRKPRSLSLDEAAAIPLVAITAYEALFDRLGIDSQGTSKGRSLLIIAGAGGVGICAGLGWCGYTILGNTGRHANIFPLIIGSFSPFTVLTVLIDPMQFGGSIYEPDSGQIVAARMAVLICGWIATALYGVVVWQMYRSMVKNFDMTIRRQSR